MIMEHFLVILLFWLVMPQVIIAQEGAEEENDDANSLAYQQYGYQWIKESLVDTCPTADAPLPFRLDDPTIEARTKGVILKYPVLIPDPEWVSFQVMDSSCTTVIPTGSGNQFPFSSDLSVTYEGSSSAMASLELEINPYGLSEYGSIVYTETERSGAAPSIESRGDVLVCVRMSLWNGVPGSDSEAIEVTFSETQTSFVVTFTVEDESYLDFTAQQQRSACTGSDCRMRLRTRLEGLDSTSSEIHRPDHENVAKNNQVTRSNDARGRIPPRSRHLCETTWGVQVFTCPEGMDLNSLVNISGGGPNNVPIPSSTPVRICIQPNEAAAEAGATLKDVESLYYKTTSTTQPAVEAGYISFDGLSKKECGEQLCIVETSLYPEISADESVTITGAVLFQPSQATSYNQIKVDVDLQLEVVPTTASAAAAKQGSLIRVAIRGAVVTTAILLLASSSYY